MGQSAEVFDRLWQIAYNHLSFSVVSFSFAWDASAPACTAQPASRWTDQIAPIEQFLVRAKSTEHGSDS